jgi:hypothetical protein
MWNERKLQINRRTQMKIIEGKKQGMNERRRRKYEIRRECMEEDKETKE